MKINVMILEAALAGLEKRKRKVEEQITEVENLLLANPPKKPMSIATHARAGKRHINAESRERIAEGQKKRWNKWRKQQKKAKRAPTLQTKTSADRKNR